MIKDFICKCYVCLFLKGMKDKITQKSVLSFLKYQFCLIPKRTKSFLKAKNYHGPQNINWQLIFYWVIKDIDFNWAFLNNIHWHIWVYLNWNSRIISVMILSKHLQFILFLLLHETADQGTENAFLDVLFCGKSISNKILIWIHF